MLRNICKYILIIHIIHNISMSIISHKTLISRIKNTFIDLSDEHVDLVYNFFKNTLDGEDLEDHDTREKKLRFMHDNIQFVNENDLKDMLKIINNMLNPPAETKGDKMKRVMLEIINKLLIAMNRNTVNDICEFKNISREELMDDTCAKILIGNRNYIFANGFSKHECQFYQKKVVNVHFSMLKGMLKQTGYVLSSKNQKKMINNTQKTITTYNVQLIE